MLLLHCIIKQRTGLGMPRSLTYTGFWCEAQSFAASSLVSRNLPGPQPWWLVPTPSICTIRLPISASHAFVRSSGDFDQGISRLRSILHEKLWDGPSARMNKRGWVRGRGLRRIYLRLSGSWENSWFNGRRGRSLVFHTSCFWAPITSTLIPLQRRDYACKIMPSVIWLDLIPP